MEIINSHIRSPVPYLVIIEKYVKLKTTLIKIYASGSPIFHYIMQIRDLCGLTPKISYPPVVSEKFERQLYSGSICNNLSIFDFHRDDPLIAGVADLLEPFFPGLDHRILRLRFLDGLLRLFVLS